MKKVIRMQKVAMSHVCQTPLSEPSVSALCLELVLSSEFGRRCRVRSRARHWLQLVGCAALLLDALNFRGPDRVGESGIKPRRSLRRQERVKEK